MIHQEQVTHRIYNPNRLLDTLIERMGLKDDGALSRRLKVATAVIRNIRLGHHPVAASMLLWMHEATGISISELRALMGDRRMKCRLSFALPK
jgi:hypothetical protein